MTNHLMTNKTYKPNIAVVIPCYKVKKHIGALIEQIPAIICRIYIIDDACPDESGRFVENNIKNDRVSVIYHDQNQGVGGAVITGYREFKMPA